MTRSAKLLIAFAITAVAIPGVARAQEPKDNKWTKDAVKLITLAKVKQNPAEGAPLYQQALGGLQEAMQKDANNPKVWLLAGEAYAGAGQFPAADSALTKAVAMHAGYAEEVAAVREQAWMWEFQKGAAALDKNQVDSALTLLNTAESMYHERPEAQLNLGVIYLNQQKYPEATQALGLAKQRLTGPLAAKLKPEDQAQWKSWEKLIESLNAQIESNQGIKSFQGENYAEASDHFTKAATINPHSRDHVYNLAESYFAQTNKLERVRKDAAEKKPPATAEVKKADAALAPLYPKQIEAAEKLLTFEPYSSDAYIMLAKAYLGQAAAANTADAKTLQGKASSALEAAQKLPFELADLSVSFSDTTATMTGKVKNHTLKPGEHAKVKVTFFAFGGEVAGAGDVDVAMVGGAESLAPFEVKVTTKGQVAGWKYEPVK